MDKIKQKLAEHFHVRIVEVQHGSGTSLTGNMARKCLKDHSTLATILRIDKELVKRLWYILLVFRQMYGVDLALLEQCCRQTLRRNAPTDRARPGRADVFREARTSLG